MYSKVFFSLLINAYSVFSVCARECKDKHVIESKPLTMPSGRVITMETFNCSNTIHAPQLPSRAVDRRHSLDFKTKRSAAQCTIANCVCGVPCIVNLCTPPSQPAIQSADCIDLADDLMEKPGGTVLIPPGQGVAFILDTCIYSATGDSSTEATEYCFDDFAFAALGILQVCGATEGDCVGTFGSSSFFVDQLNV